MQQRNAIALLITLLFVMLISTAIGYGLTQYKNARSSLKQEQSLYQNSMILEDILYILQTSSELQEYTDINSSEKLHTFLSATAYIPLELYGEKIIISLKSANAKLNINSLNKQTEPLFRAYFNKYMILEDYVNILQDNMRENKAKNEYNNYKSTLFNIYPDLFRDYIVSKKHLALINRFYKQEYADNVIEAIDFDSLFCFYKNNKMPVDVNYATPAVWQLMLNVSKKRAKELYDGEGNYKVLNDLKLTTDEKQNFEKFSTTFFSPLLWVGISILDTNSINNMHFIYDIKSKKGYNFVLDI